jgi:hypothetical protein
MRGVPTWLLAMFVGVLAAAAAGAVGASALTALVAAIAGGMLALRTLHDPPWTPAGRLVWRRRGRRWRSRLDWLRARLAASGTASAPRRPWSVPDADPTTPPEVAATGRVPVRCEIATERLQVWHSTVTNRA